MSATTMSATKLSLKLLIDKKANKVLFAEANKDFIDFLFSLMSIPVGSMINLLKKQKMVGSLGDLYESIENLSDTYVQPNQNKEAILKPKSASPCVANVPLLLSNDNVRKFYMCANYHRNITDIQGSICPQCRGQMNNEIPYVGLGVITAMNNAAGTSSNGDQEGGFVKGVVTYMVMDNLVVMPMSTISSITLLNRFSIQDVGALEEKTVSLGMDEGLELLKASLQSRSVLSDIFLGKKK